MPDPRLIILRCSDSRALFPMKPLFRTAISVITLGLFCSILSCFSGIIIMYTSGANWCLSFNNHQMDVIRTDQRQKFVSRRTKLGRTEWKFFRHLFVPKKIWTTLDILSPEEKPQVVLKDLREKGSCLQ